MSRSKTITNRLHSFCKLDLMLRFYRILAFVLLALAAWVKLVTLELPQSQHLLVLLAPAIAVILFGLYSVAALAYGVLTFRTCPEEAKALQKDIAEARADLIRKGVIKQT